MFTLKYRVQYLMDAQVDPHVYSILSSSDVACELIQLLPDGDITTELKKIMTTQQEILGEMIQGRHFGSARLEKFVKYLESVSENTEEIRKICDG